MKDKNNYPVKESDEWYKKQVIDQISESSKTSYINNIKHISMVCDNVSIHTILNKPKIYGDMIAGKTKSDNSLKSYLTTVLTFLRCSGLKETNVGMYDEWHKMFNEVYQRIQNKIESNIPNDRQKASFVQWEEVVKKRKEFPIGSPEHVLLSIYSAIPPRRQKEYYSMKLYTDKDAKPELDHNQLYLSKDNKDSYIFICEHKTSRFNKTYTNKNLPDTLIETVKKSLLKNPREYLFVKQRDKKQFTDVKAFQKYTNGMFKKIFENDDVSLNSLRHSFASYIDNHQPRLSLAQRKQIAEMMGHSLETNMAYVFLETE